MVGDKEKMMSLSKNNMQLLIVSHVRIVTIMAKK